MTDTQVLTGEATRRQRWAIYCASGLDVREIELPKQDASDLIGLLKGSDSSEIGYAIEELYARGATGAAKNGRASKKKKHEEFEELYAKAWARGAKAANEATGADCCGFAWVHIKPGGSSFARWLKAQGLARRDDYRGGVIIWIREYGQSQLCKWRHAQGMARVFQDAGIDASDMTQAD